MEEALRLVTQGAVLVIDAMALVIVAAGTIEAFVAGIGVVARPKKTSLERHEIWRRYGRWLVAGLTFQLAADIIDTSIAPSWEEIGRLGAIAAIRTFLNFFLERDLAELRERDRRAAADIG
jgi:uncharacterized membrane protein